MEVEVRTRSEDAHLGREGSAPRTLGRYRVVTELGRGSTSIVYLAAVDGPAGFNKLFALKLLRPALAEDPAIVAMFLAEARVGAQLRHPNVVSTLEIDETGPLPFIVMDYLDGQPLQKLIAASRIAFMPLPLHMHLAAVSGALEGLGHAHSAVGADGDALQIVHRDVSPHNVFVTSSGMPVLLDFGCAQAAGAPSLVLTSAGHAAYMSPEQASGRTVDARTDLFAVGVMLWEAVTRRRFWSDEAGKADILRALGAGELPPNRVSALANAAEPLRAIILKATAADPSERYESASAFQADLQGAIRQVTPSTFNLRELGQRLTTIFASERAKLQGIINAQREIAMAPGGAERGPAGSPRTGLATGEAAAPAAAPGKAPVARVSPAPSALASGPPPAPASGPLPSFPMASLEPPGWRALLRPVTIAAVAVALLFGAGLSALHIGTDDHPRAATLVSPTAASPPPETAARVEAPPVTALAEPTAMAAAGAPSQAQSPSAPGEVTPSSPSAQTRASHPAPLEGGRRAPGLLVARSRTAEPSMSAHGASLQAPEEASKASADSRGASEAPISISAGNPSAARPSHPIDQVNPYGP